MRVVAGEAWPTTQRALGELRAGLQAVASLQRRGRGQRPPVEALSHKPGFRRR
jgi:hypothetical protein